MVIDVGNWDSSIAMNSPGQSGIPGHRHYDDLFEPWASDQAFPLLYSRAAIEQATEERFRLLPRSKSPSPQHP
jgi:penicillin amidase